MYKQIKVNVFKVSSGGRHGRCGQSALRPAAWGYRRGRDPAKIRQRLSLTTVVREMPRIPEPVSMHLVSGITVF